jgi:hypothetical protein
VAHDRFFLLVTGRQANSREAGFGEVQCLAWAA